MKCAMKHTKIKQAYT